MTWNFRFSFHRHTLDYTRFNLYIGNRTNLLEWSYWLTCVRRGGSCNCTLRWISSVTEEKNNHSYPLRVRVHAHGLSGTNNRCLSSLSLHETTRRIILTSEWQASPQHGKLLCIFCCCCCCFLKDWYPKRIKKFHQIKMNIEKQDKLSQSVK